MGSATSMATDDLEQGLGLYCILYLDYMELFTFSGVRLLCEMFCSWAREEKVQGAYPDHITKGVFCK